MVAESCELPLRIVMEQPVQGVTIALFRGSSSRGDLLPPVQRSAQALVFDFDVRIEGSIADGRPRLLGAFVQGPPAARFVYLNIGRAAGQVGSSWARRTKVPLGDIGWDLVEALSPGCRLAAHIAGRARDGGPACATVPLLDPGWHMT